MESSTINGLSEKVVPVVINRIAPEPAIVRIVVHKTPSGDSIVVKVPFQAPAPALPLS